MTSPARHGGRRSPAGGRPATGRAAVPVSVSLAPDLVALLAATSNRSATVSAGLELLMRRLRALPLDSIAEVRTHGPHVLLVLSVPHAAPIMQAQAAGFMLMPQNLPGLTAMRVTLGSDSAALVVAELIRKLLSGEIPRTV